MTNHKTNSKHNLASVVQIEAKALVLMNVCLIPDCVHSENISLSVRILGFKFPESPWLSVNVVTRGLLNTKYVSKLVG